ncbi:ATP-binding cassette domain-containing protein [Ligilactobacillus agilis]|uniref:ATP-binding cassette domain-containing protein n=1 Tax=Ligilactobacillus agilis TaxID=1601 RepID=UPI00067E895D|nr:ATP-binding cassette domain-containing protein [Ligilactobacillus agilis]UNL42120.1 ATP-binding cassette domain-containing protein [Ligilactobacillus agilis]UNL58206.1 ATP-binding cassette domain-containing protein [Ligilactobacillus agilis]
MAKLEIKYITKSAPMLTDSKDNKGAPVKFWELRGIRMDISAGEAVGLIGMNTASKSLLLQIIAGNVKQTTGFITTKHPINLASLSEIDNSLSGLENIRKVIKQKEVDELKGNHLTNAVINFIDFGQWLYQPASSYSLGMKARLALGLALFIEPKVVLIDEVLGLLDRPFFNKVAQKIQDLKDVGCSFIIADTKQLYMEQFCERTMWLQFGQVQDFGPTKEVLEQFTFAQEWFNSLSLPEQNEYLADKQFEQVQFDVNKVYEEFKVEQFKHGYTRKDEPRMRKAFFVERGLDPVVVEQDQKDKQVQSKQSKASPNFTAWVLGALVILILAGGTTYWWHAHQSTSTSQVAKSKQSSSKSSKLTSSQLAASRKAASSVKAAEEASKQKASASQAQAAAKKSSEDAAKAASSAAAASSSSLAAKRANAQTIEVVDGDTLESLAEKYATTVSEIQSLNDLGSSNTIKTGDTLYVPK